MLTKTYPICEYCGNGFTPGTFWLNSNYCRAAFLLPFIVGHPGLSAWEISKATDMPYEGVAKGLSKLRDYEVVDYEPEDRIQGGIRYRYTARTHWQDVIQEWKERRLL